MSNNETCSIYTNDHHCGGFCSKHYSRFKRNGNPLKTMNCPPGTALADRLMFHAEKTTTCWWWRGSKTEGGYGRLIVDGTIKLAHRISYEVFNGEIAKGLHVLHKCDNPSCINPIHLFTGTHADNMADRARKGRNAVQATGKGSKKSSLKESDITAIVHLSNNGVSQEKLSKLYMVTRPTISAILNGKTWCHVTGIKRKKTEAINK